MKKALIVLIQSWLYAQLVLTQNAEERCVISYTNSQGVCKRADLCQSAREDFQANGIQPTFCGSAGDVPVVCCRDLLSTVLNAGISRPPQSDAPPVRRPQRPGTQAPSQPQAGKRLSERKCEEYSRRVTQTIEFLTLLPDPEVLSMTTAKCSYDNTPLIVGGQDAELNEFPHMAAIGWPLNRGGYAMKCGGTLISPRFVLTAGHCLSVGLDSSVSSNEPTVVRLGEHNLDEDVYDGADPVEIPIRRQHRHPLYRPPRRYNDIALLELATDAELSGAVRPACLGIDGGGGARTKAIATGWGVTDTATRRTSDILQKVSLDLMDNAACDPLLASLRNRHWAGLDGTQLCAGVLAGGMDSCQGDSGGPLQVASEENHCVFHVIGVTSFGGECATVNKPAVYTRVSAYLDWIESVVWPQG